MMEEILRTASGKKCFDAIKIKPGSEMSFIDLEWRVVNIDFKY